MIDFIFEYLFQPYYIIIISSIFISIICLNILHKLSNLDRLYLLSSYSVSIFGMIIGSKLLNIAENLYFYKSALISMLGGFSYMGGVLGYCICISLYNKLYKDDFPKKINNLLISALPLIYGISKIACFQAKCCYGITTLPLQIIESIIYIFIFITFYVFYQKSPNKEYVATLSLISMCIFRFFIDFLRITRNVIFLNFNFSQFICLLLIIIGINNIIKTQKNENIF